MKNKKTNKPEKKEVKKESIFKLGVDRSPNGIIITDLDGNINYANPAVTKIYGWKKKELIGKNPRIWKTDRYDKKTYKALWKSLLAGKQVNIEFTNKKRTGETLDVQTAINPIIEEDGNIEGFLAIQSDITELKRAQKELRENEDKFRNIFEQAMNGIFIMEGMKFIDCNPRSLELFGYKKKSEFIGKQASDISPSKQENGESTKKKGERMLKKLEKEGTVQFEWKHKKKDGTPFDAEVNLSYMNKGDKKQILAIVRDITEKNQILKRIQSSEARFKQLFDDAPDAYYLVDSHGKFVDGNKQAEILTGYKRAELIGKNISSSKLLGISDSIKAAKSLAKDLLGGGQNQADEFTLIRKDGTTVEVEITAKPVKIDGEVFELGLARDISERKRAENNIKKSEEKYRSLFENQLSSFAYHSIIVDKKGKACDYIFLEVNDEFEHMTGLKKSKILGKRASQALPLLLQDSVDWVKIYGEVAITGKPKKFEGYSRLMKKWFKVAAYSPGPGYFATVFDDITEAKQTEEALKKKVKEMEFAGRQNLEKHKKMMMMEKEIKELKKKLNKKK